MSEPTDVQLGAGQVAAAAVPRSRSIATRRRNAHDLILEAKTLKNQGERRCNGRAKVRDDNGEPVLNDDGSFKRKPCPNFAIKGGTVCPMHGGRAPQVKRKAQKRLLAMVEPSLIRLEALIQQNEHLPTALGAIKTVLERAGTDTPIGPFAKESGEKDMRPVIQIGIAVGGIVQKPAVAQLHVSNPLDLPAAIDAQVDVSE